jgi:hypothetical protein
MEINKSITLIGNSAAIIITGKDGKTTIERPGKAAVELE